MRSPLTEAELDALERSATSPNGVYLGVQGGRDLAILRVVAEVRRQRHALQSITHRFDSQPERHGDWGLAWAMADDAREGLTGSYPGTDTGEESEP